MDKKEQKRNINLCALWIISKKEKKTEEMYDLCIKTLTKMLYQWLFKLYWQLDDEVLFSFVVFGKKMEDH